MRKLDEIAKRGDGLLPELRSFYERLAKNPCSELLIRKDGMMQSGPDKDREIGSNRRRDDRQS
jgi:hypothetical protein